MRPRLTLRNLAITLLTGAWTLVAVAEAPPTVVDYARLNNIRALKAELAAGFDVDFADDRGTTALIAAAQMGNVECLLELIRHGASLEIRDNDRKTALTSAIWHNKPYAVQLMLLAGADVEAPGNYSPLYWAAINGVAETVDLLVKAGADVDRHSGGGETAFFRAVCNGHIEAAKILQAAGSDVDAQNNDGATSLMCAIKSGQPEAVIRAILDFDIAPNVKDSKGSCAWSYALALDQKAVLNTLREAGVVPCTVLNP